MSRINRIAWLAAGVALAALTAAPAQAQNIVTNGSFENTNNSPYALRL